MPKRTLSVILVSLGLLVLPAQAQADGTITWDTAGDSNLPCSFGAKWIILPAPDVVSATLTVGSDSFTMTKQADDSWTADSGPVPLAPSAYASFTGDADDTSHLQLTGCILAPVGGSGPSTPVPAPTPPQTEPQSFGHDVTIICKNWTWQKAKHLRLVSFSRTGVSVYRCGR